MTNANSQRKPLDTEGEQSEVLAIPHGTNDAVKANAASKQLAKDISAKLETAIRACATSITQSFEAPLSTDQPDVTVLDALERMSETNDDNTHNLRERCETVLTNMSSRIDCILELFSHITAGLENVERGLNRIVRLLNEMRRIDKISSFLAVQATIEASHVSASHELEFQITGKHISELVNASKALRADVEDKEGQLRDAMHGLLGQVRTTESRAHTLQVELIHDGARMRDELNRYQHIVDSGFSDLTSLTLAILNAVHDLYRAMQFEDMTTQVLGALKRHMDDPQGAAVNTPVSQSSMDAGDVELF